MVEKLSRLMPSIDLMYLLRIEKSLIARIELVTILSPSVMGWKFSLDNRFDSVTTLRSNSGCNTQVKT